MSGRPAGEPGQAGEDPSSLESRTYRFKVDGTRPILQIELSSGGKGETTSEAPEKLTLELHTPVSGEIFEAKTSKGRLEVDRDGSVMYFCQAPEAAGFTFFLGRSVVVKMSRDSGEVTVESPSKMLSVVHLPRSSGNGGGTEAPTDKVKIVLE